MQRLGPRRMEDSRSMSDYPPEFPDVDPALLADIVAFAESTVAWLELDQPVASRTNMIRTPTPT